MSEKSFFTYDSQLEYLTDFRVRGDLAFKVTSVRGIGKFQLQGILSSSEEKFSIEKYLQWTPTFVIPAQIFDH